MRYDITLITKDKAALGKGSELISSYGTIVSQRELAERPLKYPIGELQAASYALFVVETEQPKMVELHRAMNLSDEIVRSLVTHHHEIKTLGRDEGQDEPIVPEPVTQVPKSVEVVSQEPATALVAKKPEPKKVAKVAKKTTEVSEKERLKLLDEQLEKLLQE